MFNLQVGAVAAIGIAILAEARWRARRNLRRLPGGQQTVGPRFLSDNEVQGLLFDVDGTLIDTMPRFYPSWNIAGKRLGLIMSEEEFYGFAGMPLPEIFRRWHLRHKGFEPSAALTDEFLAAKKAAHLVHEKEAGLPPEISCVANMARAAASRGVPVAVATSGLRDLVEAHLRHCGLDDLFNSAKNNLVTAADVPGRGKPAPDIYIEAARRIGVDPAFCRAFEDGESGLLSAHRAGCHVIDVTCMDDYPSCPGLRAAKARDLADRKW